MDNLIGSLGTIVFLLLVLSTAVEMILEVFRGGLEFVGVNFAKGKLTLEEALTFTNEFMPQANPVTSQVHALKVVTSQFKKRAEAQIEDIKNIEALLGGGVAAEAYSPVVEKIQGIASDVRDIVNREERNRVFILRAISGVIGCVVVLCSDFYIFELVLGSLSKYGFEGVGYSEVWRSPTLNVIVGGLAASAGSSYWHDKLDKVRNLKELSVAAKKFQSTSG
ncbi:MULTISPECIES: hypothetical protein [Pseudomonas]|uniref:hypothetical protein n=1 Tax=Pseudomonas TaxID=286 RepID=UPI002248AD82|nr:hypothetical protein [Pseudomonas sp. DCB_BG]MCX2710181.1 hypothetical protein [Pseudomonas sp. DCB_BG]